MRQSQLIENHMPPPGPTCELCGAHLETASELRERVCQPCTDEGRRRIAAIGV